MHLGYFDQSKKIKNYLKICFSKMIKGSKGLLKLESNDLTSRLDWNLVSKGLDLHLSGCQCIMDLWKQVSCGARCSSTLRCYSNSFTTCRFLSWPVAQSCLTLCDPMDCSTPGCPVHHYLPEFSQTHVHWVSDATQLPPSPLILI